MIDVGIAGSLGTILAWMCALLLLATAAVSSRVVWAYVVRGARKGALSVFIGMFAVGGIFTSAIVHFAQTPQTIELQPSGDWVVANAYGWSLERVPANEERQVRLTSPVGQDFNRVEIRRANGDTLVLHGTNVLDALGYAFNECGAWRNRPVWGPHAFGPLGPSCEDAPWPAVVRNTESLRSLAVR